MGQKILVIEDDEAVLEVLVKRLTVAGYDVSAALDATQGVAKAYQFKPDLILLDLVLPGGGGRIVLTRLKQSARTKEIPIIVLTAITDQELVRAAEEGRIQGYIQKPYEGSHLLETIQRHLGRPPPEPVASLKPVPPAAPPPARESGPKALLLADHDADLLHALESLLMARGHRVTTVLDGESALARVRTQPPDLLVINQLLPKINGYQVCQRIHGDPALRHVPCLVFGDVAAPLPEIPASPTAAEGSPVCFFQTTEPERLLVKIEALLRPLAH